MLTTFHKQIVHIAWVAVVAIVLTTTAMIIHQTKWLAYHHPQWVSTTRLLIHLINEEDYRHAPEYKELIRRYDQNTLSVSQLEETLKTVFILSLQQTPQEVSHKNRTARLLKDVNEDEYSSITLPNGNVVFYLFDQAYVDAIVYHAYTNNRMPDDILQWMIHDTIKDLQADPKALQKRSYFVYLSMFIRNKHIKDQDKQQLTEMVSQIMKQPKHPAVTKYLEIALLMHDYSLMDEKQFAAIDLTIREHLWEYAASTTLIDYMHKEHRWTRYYPNK